MSTTNRLPVPGEVWIRLFRIAGRVVMAVGVLLLILGLWNIVAIAWFAASAERAEATVTKIGRDWSGLRMYYPCRYDAERGTVEIAWYQPQRKWHISIGSKVPILYQPDQPEEARLEAPQPYFGPGLCVVIGVFTVGFGWLFSRLPKLFKPYARPPIDALSRSDGGLSAEY